MDDDAELALLMRESELRRERDHLAEDDEHAESNSEREPLRRDDGAALPSSGAQARWRLRLGALGFFWQVVVEIGRRVLRLMELNVPRYIAFVDRCLVHVIRVSVHPRKRINTLRLLLTVAVIASIPYLIVTMYRVQLARSSDHEALELSEDQIQPVIIVEYFEEPPPTRRQALLRDGGDGLRADGVEKSCMNTRQGVNLLTDATGHVCTRLQLDRTRPGCCNETDTTLPRVKQFSCDRCDTSAPHCCDLFEHCVSCCMHPLNVELRRDYLTHVDPSHPVYRDPSNLSVFEYCVSRCRTSSASVHHQNSYRSRRTYCYGIHRPLRLFPTVNSDDNSPPSGLPERSKRIEQSPFDLDPFYRQVRY